MTYPLDDGGMVSAAGVEPAASSLSRWRSGQLSYTDMAKLTGIEPATSGVTTRRSNQLSYGPLGSGDRGRTCMT